MLAAILLYVAAFVGTFVWLWPTGIGLTSEERDEGLLHSRFAFTPTWTAFIIVRACYLLLGIAIFAMTLVITFILSRV